MEWGRILSNGESICLSGLSKAALANVFAKWLSTILIHLQRDSNDDQAERLDGHDIYTSKSDETLKKTSTALTLLRGQERFQGLD